MLCEKCGKYNATTNIRTIVNGVIFEKNLCEYCAAEEGLGVSTQNPFDSMLSSMFAEFTKPVTTKRCKVCGSSFNDIAKSGKAGCSDCYITFKSEFLPYLKRVHGSTNHTGKVPDIPQNNTPLEDLKEQLKSLILEENYEQAAVVRDKIRELEAKGNE